MDVTVEHVWPVLLPTFATPSLEAITVAGTANVADGGAAAIAVELATPSPRMLPLVSTWPGTMAANAASTLLVCRSANWLRFATVAPALQLLLSRPGCVMASPTAPAFDFA